LLCVKADDSSRFLRAPNTEGWKPTPITPIFEQYHAIMPINPSEKDPKSTACDITLEAGEVVEALVVGPDGKPLAGAQVAGRAAVLESFAFDSGHKLETARFTVGGLEPGQPRTVLVIHAERKLAKVQRVRGNEKQPLTVRLEPFGALTGRILDSKDQPRGGLRGVAAISTKPEDYGELPLDLRIGHRSWSKLTNGEVTADRDGKFRIEGLVPGLKYVLDVKDGEEILRDYTRDGLIVEANKTRDLGDMKAKRLSRE